MGLRPWLPALTCALLAGGAGCHRTFSGGVSQPNPLSQPTEVLRISEEIVIVTGDMELRMPVRELTPIGTPYPMQRYPLKNKASFTVVSRDRLRFHVQIEHKWPEYADLEGWTAVLIDDRGRRFLPDTVEPSPSRLIVEMWDYEQRTVRRDSFGDVVAIAQDGHRRRQTLEMLAVHQGRGDVVFYGRDLFTPGVRSLTLILSRSGISFEFHWRFQDT